MAIVTGKVEFRELLGGEFALYLVGVDGSFRQVWQHPKAAVGPEVVRYYRELPSFSTPLQGVTAAMLEDELRAFRPGLFSCDVPGCMDHGLDHPAGVA